MIYHLKQHMCWNTYEFIILFEHMCWNTFVFIILKKHMCRNTYGFLWFVPTHVVLHWLQ